MQHLLAFVGLNMQGMRKILKKVRAAEQRAHCLSGTDCNRLSQQGGTIIIQTT